MNAKQEQLMADITLDKMIVEGNYAPVINKAYFALMKSGDVSAFLSVLVWKVKLHKELGLSTESLVILYNYVYSNYS